MSYTPINVDAYTAAFAGAIAGMAVSGWITDPVDTDYTDVTFIAGAFAQSFDQSWNNATQLNNLEIEAITSVVQQDFSGRGPGPFNNSRFVDPTNWTETAKACVALILASDLYFAGQGITPNTPGGTTTPLSNVLYVDKGIASSGNGSIGKPFKTLATALASSPKTIYLTPYDYSSEGTLNVLATVTIQTLNDGTTSLAKLPILNCPATGTITLDTCNIANALNSAGANISLQNCVISAQFTTTFSVAGTIILDSPTGTQFFSRDCVVTGGTTQITTDGNFTMPIPTTDCGITWNRVIAALPSSKQDLYVTDGTYNFQTAWTGRSFIDIHQTDNTVIVNAYAGSLASPPWAWALFGDYSTTPSLLTNDIAENDQSIQLDSIPIKSDSSLVGPGDWIIISWGAVNGSFTRQIQSISGGSSPFTLELTEPCYFPVKKPDAIPEDNHSSVSAVNHLFQHFNVFGGKFTFNTTLAGSNARITEQGGTRYCSWNNCEFIVPSGANLVCALGLDAGNSHITLKDVQIIVEANSIQSAINFEPGGEHARFIRVTASIPSPFTTGSDVYDVIYEECSITGNGILAGGIFISGDLSVAGYPWRARNIKIIGGHCDYLNIGNYCEDIDFNSECGGGSVPRSWAVNIGAELALSDALVIPKDIRINGIVNGITNGAVFCNQVDGLRWNATINGTGDSNRFGQGNNPSIKDVVISCKGTGTGSNLFEISQPVTFRDCDLTNSTIGPNTIRFLHTNTMNPCYIFNSKISGAQSGFGTIYNSGSGDLVLENVILNPTSYGIVADAGSCEISLHNVSKITPGGYSLFICVGANVYCIRDQGGNKSTGPMYTQGAGTLCVTRGTIALNDATPVHYAYPRITNGDIVTIGPTSDGKVPTSSIIVGSEVTITGFAAHTDTVTVDIH